MIAPAKRKPTLIVAYKHATPEAELARATRDGYALGLDDARQERRENAFLFGAAVGAGLVWIVQALAGL